MGLKGNLSVVNLANVFQVLGNSAATGLLRIQAPEGSRFIEFQSGLVSIAGRAVPLFRLADLLLARGNITAEKLEIAQKMQNESGLPLTQILLEMEYVPQNAVEDVIRFQIEEEICELFTLNQGDFDFLGGAALDAKIAPGGGLVRLKIDPTSLMLEAARRADEWKDIEARIASQALLFQLTPEGLRIYSAPEGVSAEGRLVLKCLREQRTVEFVVQRTCLGRLNVNRMLVELLDAKLIAPVPVALYPEIAAKQLAAGQVEEAERLAREAAKLPDEATQKKCAEVLAGVAAQHGPPEPLRAAAVAAAEAAAHQPRKVLLKQRSPRALWLALGAVLLLGAGAAADYLYWPRPKAQGDWRRKLDEAVRHADDLLAAEKYADALQAVRDFKAPDAEARKLAADQAQRIQQDLEAKLMRAIADLLKYSVGGSPDQLQKTAEALQRFDNVPDLAPKVQAEFAKVKPKLQTYLAQAGIQQFKARLAELQADGRAANTPEEACQSYQKLLADDPPEEVAAVVRDELGKLVRPRTEAARLLERGRQLSALGDSEGALADFEQASKLAPGSALDTQAQQESAALRQRLQDAQVSVERLEMLANQRRFAEARAAYDQFLKTRPPQPVVARAMEALRGADEAAEEKLSETLREAAAQADFQPGITRKRVLDLLAQHPFSRAAAGAVLRAQVTTVPPGAEAALNGRVLGRTPLPVDLPAMGLARLSFALEGFEKSEWVGNDFRDETLTVVLDRVPVLSRLAPVAATGGLVVSGDEVVLAGPGELAVCARKDLRVRRRVALLPPPATPAAATLRGLCAFERDAFVSLSAPAVFRVNFVTDDVIRLGLDETPTGAPVVFRLRQAGNKRRVAVVTRNGLEIFEDLKPYRKTPLSAPGQDQPAGVDFDGETFFIPRADKQLEAVFAFSGELRWKAELAQALSGPPAVNRVRNAAAVVDVAGHATVFDATGGVVRARHDLGAPCQTGCLATADGFWVFREDGRGELLSPANGAALAAVTLPGRPLFPAAVRELEDYAVRDANALAVCTAAANGASVTVISVAGNAILWSARLDSPPVAAALDAEHVYVSTADSTLLVFQINR